jgi:hypothetical protein
VVVTFLKDGVVFDTPDTITITEPAPCISTILQSLPSGHYRVQLRADAIDDARFNGEFDVVP